MPKAVDGGIDRRQSQVASPELRLDLHGVDDQNVIPGESICDLSLIVVGVSIPHGLIGCISGVAGRVEEIPDGQPCCLGAKDIQVLNGDLTSLDIFPGLFEICPEIAAYFGNAVVYTDIATGNDDVCMVFDEYGLPPYFEDAIVQYL